jgi:nucleotide-binding universal stress UspA family protein
MFNNVMWATDGSAHADRALDYAKAMARHDGATLHVTHVVETLAGRAAGQDAHLNEGEIEAKITEQARAAAHEGINVRLRITAGHGGEIARRLADEAADAGADLIVVGTRGHSAVVAAVIGSVTQRLLHVAGRPVLAVPPVRAAAEPSEPPSRLTAVS